MTAQTDLTIQFKLGPNGKQPTQAHATDAGYDVYASSDPIFHENYVEYKTDLFLNVPVGWVCLIFPRSSITKQDLLLKNSVGVLDSGYQGEVGFRFLDTNPENSEFTLDGVYKKHDRIGQLVFVKLPTVSWQQVEEFGETSRSVNGWGSSGK